MRRLTGIFAAAGLQSSFHDDRSETRVLRDAHSTSTAGKWRFGSRCDHQPLKRETSNYLRPAGANPIVRKFVKTTPSPSSTLFSRSRSRALDLFQSRLLEKLAESGV
jgi:hypothetical protein